MISRFNVLFRCCLVSLALLAFWSVWSDMRAHAALTTNQMVVTNTVVTTNLVVTNTPDAHSTNAFKPFGGLNQEYTAFGLDRITVLTETKIFDQPLWKYIASLIYIFLAFYVSKFLDYLTRIWLKSWADKTETKFDDLVLELLNGPIKVVSFVILLNIGLSIFSWPEAINRILSKTLIVIVGATLTYLALKVVDLLLGWWKLRVANDSDRTFNDQLFPIVNKSLKLFVIVVAVLVTSDNMGVNITAAIASLSIGGLAIGLAAQDTLSNGFGAVAIFMDKPFRLGDHIRVDIADGTVENIGLRSTRIRSVDGHLIAIPNKTMGNATIINVTQRPNIKTELNLGLTYDTPAPKIKRATEILREIFQAHPKTADLVITFNKFTDSTLNIQVVHKWDGIDGKAQLADLQDINLTIKERFDAEGIQFAFPSQTVYLKQDSDWKVSAAEKAEKPEKKA